MKTFQKLKKKKFKDALKFKLAILDTKENIIGNLVPIGEWALKDKVLIQSFMNWRKKFMKFFFSQFESSNFSTKLYLKNLSIKKKDRIFFAIYSKKKLVGHIGLKNISRSKAELDNIIRGESGGHHDLIYFSQKQLLQWAFKYLKVKSVVAEVMSNNFVANSFHKRFGFIRKKRYFLKKIKDKKLIQFKRCAKREATENFFSDLIELKSNKYLRENN